MKLRLAKKIMKWDAIESSLYRTRVFTKYNPRQIARAFTRFCRWRRAPSDHDPLWDRIDRHWNRQ